jgi:hypothetical protein
MYMSHGRAFCPACKVYTYHAAGESALTDMEWSECLECGRYETVEPSLAGHGRSGASDEPASQGAHR